MAEAIDGTARQAAMRWAVRFPWRRLWAVPGRQAIAAISWWIFAAALRRPRPGRATALRLQGLDARTLSDLGIWPGDFPFLTARFGIGGSFRFVERNDDLRGW